MKKLKFRKVSVNEISDSLLLINLYVTQGLILLVALVFFYIRSDHPFNTTASVGTIGVLLWSLAFTLGVLALEAIVVRLVPERMLDDGGLNERLFRSRPVWHIIVIAAVVAICEEILFRGAIQPLIGIYWTSIVFTAIHIRYLRHWMMTGIVFIMSYGLGWLMEETGTIWTAIVAHFFIDVISGCVIRFKNSRSRRFP